MSRFTLLTSLVSCTYLTTYPQDELGHSLLSLTHLRRFSAYLDLEDTPRPRLTRRGTDFRYSAGDIRSFTITLRRAADVLARAMGSSVQQVCLWRPRESDGFEWLVFHVLRRDSDTELEVRCEEHY